MPARILAILAAMCLVGTFALVTFEPPMLSLADLVAKIDHSLLVAVQDWTRMRVSEWVWEDLAIPLLVRPCWLVPMAVGLLCGAGSVTLASRSSVPRSHRRRS
jgi:hypothetical protein